MAEWQGTMLERHSNLSVSRFVRSWSRSWGRFSGRACRCPQGGQILALMADTYLIPVR